MSKDLEQAIATVGLRALKIVPPQGRAKVCQICNHKGTAWDNCTKCGKPTCAMCVKAKDSKLWCKKCFTKEFS